MDRSLYLDLMFLVLGKRGGRTVGRVLLINVGSSSFDSSINLSPQLLRVIVKKRRTILHELELSLDGRRDVVLRFREFNASRTVHYAQEVVWTQEVRFSSSNTQDFVPLRRRGTDSA